MADRQNPMDRWRTDWRRNGAGMMAATFLVGGGWVSASQTFVTAKDGAFVHPSPFGWLLYVCIVGFAVGFYAWLSTYWDRLPMLGRAKARQDQRQESFRDRLRESRGNLGDVRPIQVEIVRDRSVLDRRLPFVGPESYQVAQYRQALAKLRETGAFEEFTILEIDGMLKAMDRTGKDRAYEPMHAPVNREGLAALIASGELIEESPGHYRLPPGSAQP